MAHNEEKRAMGEIVCEGGNKVKSWRTPNTIIKEEIWHIH